jgi:hypothetical protein
VNWQQKDCRFKCYIFVHEVAINCVETVKSSEDSTLSSLGYAVAGQGHWIPGSSCVQTPTYAGYLDRRVFEPLPTLDTWIVVCSNPYLRWIPGSP